MQESNKKKLIGIVLFVLFMIGQSVFAATIEPTIEINCSKDKNGNVQGEVVIINVPNTTTALQVQIGFDGNPTKSSFGMSWSQGLGSDIYKTLKVLEDGELVNEVILYLVSDKPFVTDGNLKLGTIKFESDKEINTVISDKGYVKILQEGEKPLEYNCKVTLKDVGTGDSNGSGGNDNSGDDDNSSNEGTEDSKVELITWKEMKNLDRDKVFVITFNDEVDSKDNISNFIKVYDSKKNEIPCEFVVEGNKVKVKAKKPYESQETYIMEISDKTQSFHGKILNKKIVMKFTIK